MESDQFSGKRIEPFQSAVRRRTTLLSSPSGVPVARLFSLDLQAVSAPPVYPLTDRIRLIRQLRFVLEDFYVHLHMKLAQYGYDALRALDRLEPVAADLSDEEFHMNIVQLVARTRDRHLVFVGRAINGVSATLPFEIERCWINDKETFVVSKIRPQFTPIKLKRGAIVTHWNGIPIARHVRLTANIFDGGNEPSSLARSIAFLTQRPLTRFGWPIESWVLLSFSDNGQQLEERFEWEGFDAGAIPNSPAIGRNVIGFGGDLELLFNQRTKRAAFAPASFDAGEDDKVVPAMGIPNIIGETQNFRYGSIAAANGVFAYMRLTNFVANEVDDIAKSFIEAFKKIPREGLIIDMRGNSGGYIAAGERLLQLLCPKWIIPTRFQFRVSVGTRKMIAATSAFSQWNSSMEAAHATGEPFSQGFPIEGTDEDANLLGQHYFGPVVLITDALAFSTADMFAAGFIDHGIGRVICIDKNMAAAGGNNWQFPILRLFNPSFRLHHTTARPELEMGNISENLKRDFNSNGISLSELAVIGETGSQFDGPFWEIVDGVLSYVVRYLDWLSPELLVYRATADAGLQELPESLQIGFTIRRCLRTGPNEGRLLEDLGIKPDIEYRPTLRDVLQQNQDLLIRACEELSKLPRYDLVVVVSRFDAEFKLSCETQNLTDLELFHNGKCIATQVVEEGRCEFNVPTGSASVTLKGYNQNTLVANRILNLPST